MISPPHALVTSFFRKLLTVLRREGLITDEEEDMIVPLDGGVTLPGKGTPLESFLPGKGAPRTKEADFSLGIQEAIPGLIGTFTPSRPMFVMECSVSQSERDLYADAKQWLHRSENIVRCVILVKIKEGPRTPQGNEDSDSDSDSSTMAKYQLKEENFFQDQALTAQWAGELSAWVEIWRMNVATGQAEVQHHHVSFPFPFAVEVCLTCMGWKELLPRSTLPPVLSLRREDLGLPPAGEGQIDELLVDMSPLVRDLEQTGRPRMAFWRWGNSRRKVAPPLGTRSNEAET